MALQYLFDPNKQFQSLGGVNEVGGFLRVFLNGTDDRATTYKNFDGTLNEADIVLDSYGRAVVIVDDTKTYRIEVYNRLGGLMWTVSNYKARGGSGGGTGTPVSVDGTVGEIDVDENTEGGVKHFVIGLASTIKNAIATLTMAVNGIGLSLNGKKDKQSPVSVSGGTTKTLVGISQDSDGVMTAEFDDIAFPDWTSAINAAVATCEKHENKKTTVTGFESSNKYYPTIKAVVDFVNGMLQNLGGKLITDNGDPFSSSSALPSTTPFQGVDIADKDYAYIQNTGTAERWSATVSGSSVTWQQEYAISIPVFTPSQQAAIDSGATDTKVGNYDAHLTNTNNPHNVTAAQVGALTPNGNGSNVTATFTAAGSRANISTGEKLSVIFGKIAKWFTDLKALAFKDKVSDSDISGTIADAHIASASTWNNKQNALPTTGTPSSTFAINVSGTARYSENVLPYYVSTNNDKSWLEVGTYKANNSDEMYTGITFAVKFRSVDGRTQCGFMWISVGEWKSGGDYTNDDIVCEYYTLGRRVKELPDSVKLYVNILGTSVTDGVKIYAYLAGYSNISLTPINVNKGSYTSSMTYLDAEPATKKKVTYCNILRSTYGTAIGSSSTPIYVDGNGELKECTSVAQKASSGSGNLAVIDVNGNYSSSGISAYDQTMLNGLTSRLGSFVSAINSFSHSFNVIFYGSDISKTLDFENTYASIKFLRFGISYVSGKISYRLPWSGASVDYNGWIIAPDTQTKNGKSIVHTTHTFTVAGNTNTEELYEENELGTTGQSVASIFEKQITTSQTVRGRLSSEIRLYNGVSYKELIVHVDIGYERLSSTGAFFAFGTVTCNTDLFEND